MCYNVIDYIRLRTFFLELFPFKRVHDARVFDGGRSLQSGYTSSRATRAYNNNMRLRRWTAVTDDVRLWIDGPGRVRRRVTMTTAATAAEALSAILGLGEIVYRAFFGEKIITSAIASASPMDSRPADVVHLPVARAGIDVYGDKNIWPTGGRSTRVIPVTLRFI